MTLELLSGIYNNFKITIKTNILFPSYIFLFFLIYHTVWRGCCGIVIILEQMKMF